MGDREQRDDILADQVALMCRLVTLPVVATVPAAVAVAIAIGPGTDVALRGLWVMALGVLAASRLFASHAYLARPRDGRAAHRWVRLLLLLTALSGAAWSLAGTVLLPVAEPLRESLTSMCLVAALAAGYSAMSPLSGAYAALAVPFLLPMAVWQLYLGGWHRQILGGVYLIFLLLMIAAAQRAARATREQLRLARENAALAASLRSERDALDRANAELKVASEAKSRFLGHMSHELRTPLAVILGYSDLLLRDEPAGRRADALARIRRAGDGLLAIVNDLLDVASLEAGELRLDESEFVPAEFLGEVAATLRAHPEARELRILHEVGDGVPARLRADRDRLRQVLLSLGVNALHATSRGRVTLAFARAGAERAGLWLRAEVADTGIGIAPEAQARLFEAFARVEPPGAGRGAGLGLALCRSIVERMGGQIGVVSVPGAGSTFWFEIPVIAAAEAAADPFGAQVPDAFAGAVLVAADSAETRGLLGNFLRESGCAPVVAVAGGAELVAAAGERPFDLILLEDRPGGVDGVAALTAIRAAERAAARAATPVVVVVADAAPGERARLRAAGAHAVIDGPADVDRLAALVRPWLHAAPATGAAPLAAAHRAVLVADDHAGNRQLLRELLEDEGFARVEAVATGAEAVAAWEQGIYDLLLLDWQMPGLDGVEAVRRIRALELELGRPRTAILIVTGRQSDAERDACVAAGADGCVAKPYAPGQLLAAAERALSSVGR